ncbi:MAG: rRNA pseudouridine synthase [Deltaproteobacteria bacterium]|nr:rRNA pseudouridine synthase [Deltaproteobacteria bacterium]
MQDRLQKILARAGIASRRVAEQMIREGRVSVNDTVVTQLGTKADIHKDTIKVNGKLILTDVSDVYLMMNKPRGYLTTLKDTKERPIVTDLLEYMPDRVFPVGRLDYDSEGLLLMTNDGDFAHRIQHPKFEITKTYRVKVRGTLSSEEIAIIRKGARLDDGEFTPVQVSVKKMNPRSCWLELTIHEGRNRIIRRFFDAFDHPVTRLIRVAIGDLHLGDLPQGEFRYLQKGEVQKLLMLSGP